MKKVKEEGCRPGDRTGRENNKMKKNIIAIVLVTAVVIAGVLLFKSSHKQDAQSVSLKKKSLSKTKAPVVSFERVKVIPEGIRLPEWQEDYNPNAVIEIASEETSQLCEDLKESIKNADSDMIMALSRKLAELGNEAVPALIDLINCGHQKTELEGLRILSLIETPESIAAALGKLVSNSDNEQFLKQFSNIHTPAVAQLLVRLLGETDQPALLESIRNIMSAMEGVAVVDALAAGMQSPTDIYHLQDCAAILAELAKPSNIPSLIYMLETSDNSTVRAASAIALGNIGNADACNALANHAETSKEDEEVCLASLSAVNSPYGQDFLFTILQNNDYSGPVRVASAQALGNYNSSHVLDRLTQTSEAGIPDAINSVIEESVDSIHQRIDNNVAQTAPSTSEFIEIQ